MDKNCRIKYLGILIILTILFFSCKGYKIVTVNSLNINAENKIEEYNFNELNLDAYRDSIAKEMDEIINHSDITMNVGCPEGLLGNFITDLSQAYVKREVKNTKYTPDFCVLNNGGFRNSLNKGPIRIRDIFEIMPFDNYLVILEIEGDIMLKLLNYIQEKSLSSHQRKSGVPLSGMRIKLTGDKINRCFINTKEFNPGNKYKILTTNYLANGGDGMSFLKDCKILFNTKLLLRDVIISYVREIGDNNIKVNAQLDGRIQINQ